MMDIEGCMAFHLNACSASCSAAVNDRRIWDQYRLATGGDCTFGIYHQVLRFLGRDPYQQMSPMPFPVLPKEEGTNEDEYQKVFDWCLSLYQTVSQWRRREKGIDRRWHYAPKLAHQ